MYIQGTMTCLLLNLYMEQLLLFESHSEETSDTSSFKPGDTEDEHGEVSEAKEGDHLQPQLPL